MQIRGLGKVPVLLLSILFLFCFSGTAPAGHIQLNGYIIDVKGQEPTVPADLEPSVDGKYKRWIVQFSGPIQEPDKNALVDLGCRMGDYLPDFAFIVTMDNKTKKQVEELPFINGVVRYKPAYKVDKKLKNDSGEVIAEKGKKVKLAVKLDGKDNQPVVLSEVHKKKGKVLDVSNDIVRIEVEQADISSFAAIEEVIWIEEAIDLKLLNDTSKWTIQTYVSGNIRIWDKGLHGEGQIVGIGDSGLDHDMPWFRDPAGTAVGPTHRKVVGYDTTYGDDYDADYPGHGTHVAGIVGGDRTPVDGLSTANGMAPKSRFFMQDLTPGSSTYVYPPSDLGLLFITAYNAGARLHTNSWGGGGNSYNSTSMSADRFMWDHKEFLALFANGNSGPGAGTVGYPASAKNVVSVGASLNGTGAESVASFSSNGPTADGRIKPTVTAPGDGATEGAGIISADSDGVKNSNNSGAIAMRGTSMATPATAGAAALIRQYYTEGYYPGGSANSANAFIPSAALIKATLINSAQNMTGNYTDGPIPSTGQGWGRINLSNTFTFTGDGRTLEVHDISSGLATGESRNLTYYADGTQPFKITLVWTDYPGTVGAAKALVNDLDLRVTAPDGVTTYLGNVFTNGESASGGSADRLNVEEQVLIRTPATGTYTVAVTGYNVPSGPQPFSVVITGASNVVSKGTLSLSKTRYNGSATAEIKVADRDLDTDSAAIEEIFVNIKSTTEPDGELVRLVETGPATAVFIGSIKLNPGTAVPGDGIIEVADGDVLTAMYYDADDGSGSPAVVTASAHADLSAPVFSTITANTGESSATIIWDTDEPADSLVNYGQTPDRGAVATSTNLVTKHTLFVANLKEGGTYYYSLSSTDEAGNTGTNDNGGSLYMFTTQNVPPALTAYSSNGTETDAGTTMIYGTATDYSGVTSVTVNGTPAAYRISDGYYELEAALVVGDNTFAIIATDGAGNAQYVTLIVTKLPPPDLSITAVSGPASVGVGSSIAVKATVSAAAAGGNAGPFIVGIYISNDSTITTADYLIGHSHFAKLARGSSVTFDTPTSDINLSPGTYYIGAIADYTGLVAETDETNNALTGNQIIVLPPDLRMFSVSYPASTSTGVNIAFSDIVQALDAYPKNFTVCFYLSTDNNITTSDLLLGSRTVTSVSGYTATTNLFIPKETESGTYYLGAIADCKGTVQESDETNNALAGKPITILRPDLTMTALTGPTSGLTGGTVLISNTATSSATGGNANYVSVGIYLSEDATITTADRLVGSRTIPVLNAGESSAYNTTANIPIGLKPGTYYLGAIVDDNNNIIESDETNNVLLGGQFTVIGPDLFVSAVSGPEFSGTNADITVTTTIAASASGGKAGNFNVALYLSADSTISILDDRKIATRSFSGLAPGATITDTATVNIPVGITPGTYYIGAIVDIADWVPESDETNNSLAGNQITIARPDLMMTAVSGPATAGTNASITVTNTASAAPSAGNSTSFSIGIYLSTDAAITTSDIKIGSRTVNNLASGASDTAATALTLPSSVQPGTYYIGAIADYYNNIVESDETNNALTGNQITIVGPDLTMTAVSGPSSGITGGTVTVSNTAAAALGGNAGTFSVGIYLSTDNVITTSDTKIGSRSVSSLAAGSSSTANTTVTIPNTLAPGTYFLGVIADFEKAVSESDEANNALTGNQIIIIGPDLTIAAVSGPSSAIPGGSITISSTLAASASGGSAGSSDVGIYLSADSTITTSDMYLGSRTVSSLAPGTTNTDSVAALIPQYLTPGTYYIGAIADVGNLVKESDETNNAFTGNQIIIIGPDLTISAVSGPSSAVTGGSITISSTLAASASGGNAGSSDVGIYLSADSTITTSDMYLGSRSVSSLAPGTTDTGNVTVSVSQYLMPGTYYIGAVADYNNAVKESDETNNALAGNQITIVGADLSMTAVSGPSTAAFGETIAVTNTVTAAPGGGYPSAFTVGIYISEDAIINSTDYLVGTRMVTNLAPGQSSTEATAIVIPTTLKRGTYYIGAIADYVNSVKESNEANNNMTGNTILIKR